MRHPTGFFSSQVFLGHGTPPGHPERPERLRTLLSHLKKTHLLERLIHYDPLPATDEQVLRVHAVAHLGFVRSVCERGGGMLDEGDTHAVPRSCDAALLAAGACVGAVDAVLGKEVESAFCAVRPPGHHAERDRAMGFCLFNNVAIAAQHARVVHGLDRVAILDWDVHHGNGTQHLFEDDPSVLYISLHQYPFYPGTGARHEHGKGAGEGTTLNFPLPAGTGEDRYREIFNGEIIPALEQYGPGLLLISAGFDAHREDPLGGMELTEESFGILTKLVRDIAPVVSVLEGGYNLDALARSVEKHLEGLMN